MAAKVGQGVDAVLERLAPPKLWMTPLADVLPNRWNGKRKADAGLVASIRAMGILQTLVGRPVGARIELVCGSRRLDAARQAGLREVPMAVYADMTDQQARECNAIENLQRENKTPLEEARTIAELLKGGKSPKEVAAHIGRPWTFVVRRAKLADLAPEVQRELDDPQSVVAQNASVLGLEMLALYPHEVQRQYCKDHARQAWAWGSASIQAELAGAVHALKLAPWPSDDALLVAKAGACLACRKRTGAQPGLFDEVDDPVELLKQDRCLDPDCWAAKQSAWLDRAEQLARAKHPGLLKVATELLPHDNALCGDASVLGAGAFEQVKKADVGVGVVPALVVYGPGKGRVIHVRLKQKPEADEQKRAGADKATKSEGDKRAELASRRVALLIVQRIRPGLEQARLPKPGGDPLEAVKDHWWLRLICAFGAPAGSGMVGKEKAWGWFDASSGDDADELHKMLWQQLKPQLLASVAFGKPTQLDPYCMVNARRLAWLLGLDWAQMEQWAAVQLPEPKSWSKPDAT